MFNVKAVDHFGIDFMERINNLDLSGALASITNRFGNSQPVSNVMNRYYNTTKIQEITIIQLTKILV